MHLEKLAGELQFISDSNETREEQDFCERMKKYKLIQQGASIFIYNRHNDELLSHYNPFDNTQLVCSPDGFQLANEFGAKRFLALKARNALMQASAHEAKAENFSRDRAFPLKVVHEASNPYTPVNLEQLLEINKQNPEALYDELADLFDRCADFIPEKQAEYRSGGRKQDKFCRFNTENPQPQSGTVTKQLFLLDENKKIIGTISSTICTNPDGLADIYLYDEVVDYFTQIDPSSETMKRLQALYSDTSLSLDDKKAEIGKIIEPIRLKLMAPLFAAIRQQIKKTLSEIYPHTSESEINHRIENGAIRAFIRAADKRVSSYEQLGCGTENHAFYVIHGKPTPAAKLMDSYVKEVWAQSQLHKLRRNPMQANAMELVGINVNLGVAPDGTINLNLNVSGTKASEVVNELETTHFVNLEDLPAQTGAREGMYAHLLKQLDGENGKHYITTSPLCAAELITHINKMKPGYTDSLVKRTNLVFAHPEQAKEFKELPDEYSIDVLKEIKSATDLQRCASLAKFQKDRLLAMRPSLPDAAALKKMDERYSEEALVKKAESGRIMVLSAIKDKQIVATLVFNFHATQNESLLDKTVYISDLIIEKGFIDDERFVMGFMVSALASLAREFPSAKTVTFMAPGNPSDPLVRCIEKAKSEGLLSALTKDKQADLGLVSYFVQEPQNKPKLNLSNTPANMFHHRPQVSTVTVGEQKQEIVPAAAL